MASSKLAAGAGSNAMASESHAGIVRANLPIQRAIYLPFWPFFVIPSGDSMIEREFLLATNETAANRDIEMPKEGIVMTGEAS
jgi:hypothetical protein